MKRRLARHTNDPRRQRFARQLLEEWRAEVAGQFSIEGRTRTLLSHLLGAAGLYFDEPLRRSLCDVWDEGEPGPAAWIAEMVGRVSCARCHGAVPVESISEHWLCVRCLEVEREVNEGKKAS